MASLFIVFVGLLKICFYYLEAFYRLFVPTSKKSIAGKVVLVTGAGRGIGKELALQFADLGAKLALWDINKNEIDENVKEIRSKGGQAFAYKCDVSDCDDVKRASVKVKEDLRTVDVVVNNAGILNIKDFLSLTEQDITRTININTTAHFWVLREFLPDMLDRNDGHVVTMASMAGKGGSPLITDYCASKHAVIGFTEALSEEIRTVYKKPGVKTTTVCPMFVNTNLVKEHEGRIHLQQGPMCDMMTPAYAASQIIDGVLRNKTEIYLPQNQAVADLFRAIFPRKAIHVLRDLGAVGCFQNKTKAE